jgi:hypothetical protein
LIAVTSCMICGGGKMAIKYKPVCSIMYAVAIATSLKIINNYVHRKW